MTHRETWVPELASTPPGIAGLSTTSARERERRSHEPRTAPSAMPRHNERRHPADRPPTVDPAKTSASSTPDESHPVQTSTTPIARSRASNTEFVHCEIPRLPITSIRRSRPIHLVQPEKNQRAGPAATETVRRTGLTPRSERRFRHRGLEDTETAMRLRRDGRRAPRQIPRPNHALDCGALARKIRWVHPSTARPPRDLKDTP